MLLLPMNSVESEPPHHIPMLFQTNKNSIDSEMAMEKKLRKSQNFVLY